MKKELLRGLTMLALIVTLALATAVVSANPQATGQVVANVPFEFSVGYKLMPAGQYSVQEIVSANGLLIKSADGKNSALRLSNLTRRIRKGSPARLVFHRYGERYFLAEVWNGSGDTGRQLLKSQEERGIERELTIASTRAGSQSPNATSEIVEVLAVLR